MHLFSFQALCYHRGLGPFFCLVVLDHADAAPVDDVNPFVGTAAHGHTYPEATVPFGLVQLSPGTLDKSWDGRRLAYL